MTILLTLHVIVTIAMIGVILLQKSDGSSALMGGGSSSSMFSARGVANLLTHMTAVLAAIFLILCIVMTWVSTHNMKKVGDLLDDGMRSTKNNVQTTKTEEKPVESVPAQSNQTETNKTAETSKPAA